MSAPSAIGLHRNGDGTVLSITSGTPCACATSATAAMSSTVRLGLPRLSANTARVFGRIAAAKASGCVASTKRGLDAELRQVDRQHRHRAAVQRAGRHHVVALLQHRHQRHRLGGHAAGRGDRGAAAFERRDALLERRHRRVGQPRIDVAEGLQVEQRRRVVGAVEHEAGGLVDRQRARAGGGVGDLAGVDGQRLGLEDVVGHGRTLQAGRPRRDHAGVDARPVQAAEQARVFDLHAAVHHRVEPGRARQSRRPRGSSRRSAATGTSRRSRWPARRSAARPSVRRNTSTMSTGCGMSRQARRSSARPAPRS